MTFRDYVDGAGCHCPHEIESVAAQVAPVEQMEEGGPILWKALPVDRLAWVGWRTHKPTLVALFNCFREVYVYGEPGEPTLESVMRFGTPACEPTLEIQNLWRVGYDAAVALGVLRTWKPPETV